MGTESTSRPVTFGLLALLFLFGACGRNNMGKAPAKIKAPGKSELAIGGQTFAANLPSGISIPGQDDAVSRRVLSEYGAVLVARGGAVPPPVIIFPDAASVDSWQAGIKTMRTDLGGTMIELQAPAMTALMEARAEAKATGLNISPRDTDAGRRSYEETVKLWVSRVNPGMEHWIADGRLTQNEAARIRALAPREQIAEILRLENDGLYFSKDFSKSILQSVAAPGASQHLSMLAFDVREYEDPSVRSILARHGWFQTVSSDTPHFTFLGVAERELSALGLRKVSSAGRTFWIPRLE